MPSHLPQGGWVDRGGSLTLNPPMATPLARTSYSMSFKFLNVFILGKYMVSTRSRNLTLEIPDDNQSAFSLQLDYSL